MSRPAADPIERFWSHVDRTSDPGGCWLWTKTISRMGYGLFANKRNTYHSAHRAAYEFTFGAIPEGYVVDHVASRGCRHRHCVNPAHLEVVTQRENVARGTSVVAQFINATHCIHGHAFDAANTYIAPSGQRKCRTCHRNRERSRRQTKRQGG